MKTCSTAKPIPDLYDVRRKLSRRDVLKYGGLYAAAAVGSRLPLPALRLEDTQGVPLRHFADRIVTPTGKRFKVGITPSFGDEQDPTGLPERLATEQFNQINGTAGTSVAPGQWDWWGSDQMVQKANAANQSVRSAALVWGIEVNGAVIPSWIANGGYTRDQLIGIMEDHIAAVMGRYRGVIDAYEVVGEYNNDGRGTDDWWYQRIGPDYLQIAFQKARQVDPTAILIYGHWNNHIISEQNYKRTLEDVKSLKTLGVIDAVGLQMHMFQNRPTKAMVIEAMRSFGLPVWVTEFDSFQLRGPSGSAPPPDDPEEDQAALTENILEAALESGVCESFTFFGVSDRYNAWKDFYGRKQYYPCLWDESNNAKLNYYAVQRVLRANVTLGHDLFFPLTAR